MYMSIPGLFAALPFRVRAHRPGRITLPHHRWLTPSSNSAFMNENFRLEEIGQFTQMGDYCPSQHDPGEDSPS